MNWNMHEIYKINDDTFKKFYDMLSPSDINFILKQYKKIQFFLEETKDCVIANNMYLGLGTYLTLTDLKFNRFFEFKDKLKSVIEFIKYIEKQE